MIASKSDEKWLANYETLKAHVAETGHFPDKHCRLNNWCRYQRKCIKSGTLEDWKRELFEKLAASRRLDEHTGGRNKKINTYTNMAFYKIHFTLNGERHFTSGMSSYPSADMIDKGEEINRSIVLDNAMFFIGGYMDAMHLTGRVNPDTVHYELLKDMPKE